MALNEYQALPFHVLIGDADENFYQLGLKDKDSFDTVQKHMLAQMRLAHPKVDKILQKAMQGLIKPLLERSSVFGPLLKCYAQGLERPVEEIAQGLLVPEILSSLAIFPKLSPLGVFGCSSFFALDKDSDGPIHGRILDFSLVGSFDLYERALIFNFKDQPQIFSYGTTAFAYPSLTAMNSHGVSVAIHQKFTPYFNPKGQSIFEIVYQLLCEVDNYESALRFLRKSRSLTTWGINLLFQDGKVLLADLQGDQLFYKEENLRPNEIIYTNNLPLNEAHQNHFVPSGFGHYCSMREHNAKEKMANYPQGVNQLDLLELMSTPLNQNQRAIEQWNWDCLTPSTIAVSTMNPLKGESLFNLGKAPKVNQQKAMHFSNLWKRQGDQYKSEIITLKKNSAIDSTWKEGQHYYALAISAFDKQDIPSSYHYMQMAKSLFAKNNHHESWVAQFYFLVYQYIFENHPKVRSQILEDFIGLEGKLAPYLNQHRLLFIFRLEKELIGKWGLEKKQLQGEALMRAFALELMMPRMLMRKIIAKAIRPRPELLDIVYLYAL